MAGIGEDPDGAIRAQAFAAVERLTVEWGGRIPWAVIDKGFEHGAERIEFASKAGGIFKPRQMSAALSIKTTMPRAGRPSWYRDQGAGIDGQTGLLPYDLVRKKGHWTNEALRRAYERRAPLIYFRAVESACYEAIWPVWIEEFGYEAGGGSAGGCRYRAQGSEFGAGGGRGRADDGTGEILHLGDKKAPESPSLVQ